GAVAEEQLLVCGVRTHRRQLPRALFPYTTLFRSQARGLRAGDLGRAARRRAARDPRRRPLPDRRWRGRTTGGRQVSAQMLTDSRSEEHTSELQSRENLVCRLLLAKKSTSTIHT